MRVHFYVLFAALLWVTPFPTAAWGQSPSATPPRTGTSPQEEPALDDVISGFDEKEEGHANANAEARADGGEVPADLEKGFDDDEDETAAQAPAEGGTEAEASIWSLGGFARLDSSYSYAHDAPEPGQPDAATEEAQPGAVPEKGLPDYRGLSKLRIALQLELSVEPGAGWLFFLSGQANQDFSYQLNDRGDYANEDGVLDAYEQEVEFREVFARGSPFEALDVKLGRQIVVWGKSDNIRLTDVLNPVDNREPGVVDIEDMRLPVTMTRLDYFPADDWSLTAIAVHEIRFNKDPVFGSEFYPFPTPPPDEEVPTDGPPLARVMASCCTRSGTGRARGPGSPSSCGRLGSSSWP